MASTIERLRKIFIENFQSEENELKPDASLESLGLDSLDKIDFLFEIEEEFKIRIEPSDIKTDNIQGIVDCIDCLVAESQMQSAMSIKDDRK